MLENARSEAHGAERIIEKEIEKEFEKEFRSPVLEDASLNEASLNEASLRAFIYARVHTSIFIKIYIIAFLFYVVESVVGRQPTGGSLQIRRASGPRRV